MKRMYRLLVEVEIPASTAENAVREFEDAIQSKVPAAGYLIHSSSPGGVALYEDKDHWTGPKKRGLV